MLIDGVAHGAVGGDGATRGVGGVVGAMRGVCKVHAGGKGGVEESVKTVGGDDLVS
jgi:hypothetical protein